MHYSIDDLKQFPEMFSWLPQVFTKKLMESNTEYDPDDPLTWSTFSTVGQIKYYRTPRLPTKVAYSQTWMDEFEKDKKPCSPGPQ